MYSINVHAPDLAAAVIADSRQPAAACVVYFSIKK